MKFKIISLAIFLNFLHICVLYWCLGKEYLKNFLSGVISHFPGSIFSLFVLMLPTFLYIAMGLIVIDPAKKMMRLIAVVLLFIIDLLLMKFLYEGFVLKLSLILYTRLVFNFLFIMVVVCKRKSFSRLHNKI